MMIERKQEKLLRMVLPEPLGRPPRNLPALLAAPLATSFHEVDANFNFPLLTSVGSRNTQYLSAIIHGSDSMSLLAQFLPFLLMPSGLEICQSQVDEATRVFVSPAGISQKVPTNFRPLSWHPTSVLTSSRYS